jgi:hypothetical protein
MANALTGSFSWNTPVVYNSGDVFQAADYNNVVKNVATVYAKPYGILIAGTTATVAANADLFLSAQSPSLAFSNASGAGSVTFTTISSHPSLTAPITGLYRITCQVVCAHSPSQVMGIRTYGQGASSANFQFNTGLITTAIGSGLNSSNYISFVMPMSAYVSGASTAYPSSVYFNFNSTASQSVIGATSSLYQTFASLEYLGSATNI